MSKAFVNEDAAPPETDLQLRELVDPENNYMTPSGLEDLQKQISNLSPSEGRFKYLERLIKTAKVIVPENQSGDRVVFGSTVEVRSSDGETRTYKLVGAYESDIKFRKISFVSPLGKALLQTQVRDIITFRSPSGEEELEILSIKFEKI